jgi:hypothetical protein
MRLRERGPPRSGTARRASDRAVVMTKAMLRVRLPTNHAQMIAAFEQSMEQSGYKLPAMLESAGSAWVPVMTLERPARIRG